MPVQIALLRAINVGGRGKLSMADLRAFFVELGFADARTLLQTGNVVFTSDVRQGRELELYLAEEARRRLALDTDFLVRSAEEWRAVVTANPFPDEAKVDPSHLLVAPLTALPPPAAVEALRAAIRGRERIDLAGRELYVVYPDGIGDSKLTLTVIERKLGVRATGRNWNTVMKLAAMVEQHPGLPAR